MPYFASFHINAQNNNPICMNKFTIDIDETFKYYYRPLCLYVLHYVHDTDIAEDIVQDSFSILWEKLSISGAEIENVKAYLYTTARNRSLDYLKKEEIYDPNLSPSDFEDTLSDEEAEERSVREARMWTAIDALPERCREIFLMNKRDGMKYKEIAAKFQISVNTVDNHISKALRLIREGTQKVYAFLFN